MCQFDKMTQQISNRNLAPMLRCFYWTGMSRLTMTLNRSEVVSNLAVGIHRQQQVAALSDILFVLLWPLAGRAAVVWYQKSTTRLQPALYHSQPPTFSQFLALPKYTVTNLFKICFTVINANHWSKHLGDCFWVSKHKYVTKSIRSRAVTHHMSMLA